MKTVIGPSEDAGGRTEVSLVVSERNLLTMLDKLYWANSYSAREIQSNNISIRDMEGTLIPVSGIISLKVETDEEHYKDRPHPAGKMHPKTEAALIAVKENAAAREE